MNPPPQTPNNDIKTDAGLGLGRPNGSSHVSMRASSASHLPLTVRTSSREDGSNNVPFPLSASSSHLPRPDATRNHSNGYLAAPSAHQMHPKNSLSSSTTTSSSNQDALHVQRTYQRIAQVGGIPGDGFVAGVELTRERRTEASISGYLSPLMASTSSGAAAGRLAPPNFARQDSGPAFGNLLNVGNNSNAYAFTARSSHDDQSFYDPASATSSRKPSLVPSARSAEDEADELKLLEKVDRYGFFAPTYAQHARLVLLSQKACLDLPPESALKASTSSRRKSSGAAGDPKKRAKRVSLLGGAAQGLESPYIHMPNDASPDSSRRSSLQRNGAVNLASSSSNASRRSLSGGVPRPHAAALVPENVSASSSYTSKEASRTNKWYNEMLQPEARDAGGNVTSWRLARAGDKDDATLMRRVCKGLPDRWRAAAWEAMIHRRRKPAGRSSTPADDAALTRRFYVSGYFDPVWKRNANADASFAAGCGSGAVRARCPD